MTQNAIIHVERWLDERGGFGLPVLRTDKNGTESNGG